MTDNEIIKALGECTKHKACEACHFMDKCYDLDVLHRQALDLINRQKAEIEAKSKKLSEILPIVAEIRNNAVKEFAEELKDRKHFITMNIEEFECCIDNLLKETVGEADETG